MIALADGPRAPRPKNQRLWGPAAGMLMMGCFCTGGDLRIQIQPHELLQMLNCPQENMAGNPACTGLEKMLLLAKALGSLESDFCQFVEC